MSFPPFGLRFIFICNMLDYFVFCIFFGGKEVEHREANASDPGTAMF